MKLISPLNITSLKLASFSSELSWKLVVLLKTECLKETSSLKTEELKSAVALKEEDQKSTYLMKFENQK